MKLICELKFKKLYCIIIVYGGLQHLECLMRLFLGGLGLKLPNISTRSKVKIIMKRQGSILSVSALK